MRELVCIVCPKGCRLHVDESNDYAVTGNACARGEDYGKNEVRHPVRAVTSTVAVEGAALRRCPVKLDAPIEKARMLEAVRLLDGVVLQAPVEMGQIVVSNVLDTGCNFVATRGFTKE